MSVVDSECFYNHMSERICDVQRLQESSSLKTVVIAKKTYGESLQVKTRSKPHARTCSSYSLPKPMMLKVQYWWVYMNSSLTSLIKSVWSRCSFAEYDTFGFGDIHESPPVFVDDFPNCCSLRVSKTLGCELRCH